MTLTQDALRRAEGNVGAAYVRLRAEVLKATAVHTDDMSWRKEAIPTEMAAAIGIEQLKKCDRFWQQRQYYAELYN